MGWRQLGVGCRWRGVFLLCLLCAPQLHLFTIIIPNARATRAAATTLIAGWRFRFFQKFFAMLRHRSSSRREKQVQSYQRIWQTVQQIPHGMVASYGQIADLAGLPGRSRLVAKALKHSPTPLPWHRVVRSSGHIAFAKGSQEALEQRALLLDEGVCFSGQKVDARYHWQPELAELLFGLSF